MAEPEYELFAIRYATRDARRSDHFIRGDPDDGPMPMDRQFRPFSESAIQSPGA
jgi:hypothetical protein